MRVDVGYFIFRAVLVGLHLVRQTAHLSLQLLQLVVLLLRQFRIDSLQIGQIAELEDVVVVEFLQFRLQLFILVLVGWSHLCHHPSQIQWLNFSLFLFVILNFYII